MVTIKTTMSSINTPSSSRRSQIKLTQPHLALLALILLSAAYWIYSQLSPLTPSPNKCLVSHGTYSGTIYTKPGETTGNKCLVQSSWMRLAQHTVQLPNTNGKVIDDWLWIDYHDRINVLVEAPSSAQSTPDEKEFIILSQTKYALTATSLAIVGGIIEPSEESQFAAQREVKEELGVSCKEWKALGKFRTDVNRGMGWVHPYLATDCSYSSSTDNNPTSNGEEEVGGHDTEKQHIQTMKLSEVKEAVLNGKFVEVQWSNTVALAMLHLS